MKNRFPRGGTTGRGRKKRRRRRVINPRFFLRLISWIYSVASSACGRSVGLPLGLMYGNVCGETEVRIFPATPPSFPPPPPSLGAPPTNPPPVSLLSPRGSPVIPLNHASTR